MLPAKPPAKTGMQSMMENILKNMLGEEGFARMQATFETIGDGVTEIRASLKRIELAQENLSDRIGRLEKELRIPMEQDTPQPNGKDLSQ